MQLGQDDLNDAALSNALNNMARKVYDAGDFDIDMMAEAEAMEMTGATFEHFQKAIEKGLRDSEHAGYKVSPVIRYALENNAFVFSGFKTYHMLREVGLSITDDAGNIKPFERFLKDVHTVDERYNRNYLRAEYNHAVGSSMMAAQWQKVEQDGDRYDLQYRTANDSRVRPEHAVLDGITLPVSDPFWNFYYPPNDWNCRCNAVQVLKGKFPESDPKEAMRLGNNSTDTPKKKMFRFNSGKTLEVFPPKHPYYKVPQKDKEKIRKLTDEKIREKRIKAIIKQLEGNLTDEEKKAKAANIYEIEKALNVSAGKAMSIEKADKQNANPNYGKSRGYGINCQTCAPAYALRRSGLDVTAKENTSGSQLDYLSRGMHCWEIWKNQNGTQATHTRINDWLRKNNFLQMTPKRYQQFFEESCKETGIYEVSIGWKGGGGHATILERTADGKLIRIEPQRDNSKGSKCQWDDFDFLCKHGAARSHDCRGVMRVDNKLFNIKFASIFDKGVNNTK
jgi:SPP1 gp7 family putative phage head morphogenesis protein